MKETVSGKVKIIIFVVGIICALTALLGSRYVTTTQQTITETSGMAFNERPENSDATDSDYVKFDAYFEKDGKKYEGIREELNNYIVLKTDLKVLTTGALESASIELADGNFEMVNNISETGFIKSVGTNKIEFNEMQPGDQQPINITLKQNVVFEEKSAGKKFNKNRLSKKDNKITFKGKYRRADGTIQDITKEITFRIDWYGEIHFESDKSFALKLGEPGTFIVDKENEKVYMVVNPFVYTKVPNSDNVLAPDAAAIIEADLPKMNGYFPKSVTVNDMAKYKKDIQEPEYDSQTGKLKIRMENPVDENGEGYIVGVTCQYKVGILIEYPYQAYDAGDTTENYSIEANAYLEGYSTEEETGEIVRVNSEKQSEKFTVSIKDPKGSVLLYHVNIVEDSLKKANSRLIYTKNVNVESTYRVDWSVNFYSYDNQIEKFVFAEDYTTAEKIDESAYKADFDHFSDDNKQYYNMEDFVNYIGIAVDEKAFDVLGEDGYIEVWDTDSNRIIKTIELSDAGEFIPYGNSVKHIRIETNKPESVGTINIQNYKEIDNEALKQEYPNEETFDKFSHLYSSLHGKVKYRGQSGLKSINGDVKEIEYREGSTAYYPTLDDNTFDPQKLNSHKLYIYFYGPDSDYDANYVAWIDPTIILEFPEAFQKIVYNSFRAEGLTVKDTEVSKVGEHVILKIETEGIMEIGDYGYLDFQSELDIPKSISDNKIRVFAHNSNCDNFEFHFTESKPAQDIYDVDGDGDYNEERRVESVQIIYAQTNSLITRTQITDFDKEGTIIECPGEGTVYDKENATGEARINVRVLNGYEQNINDVVIVGRIPFEGNKFTINSQNSLNSTFSTTMKADGVKGEEETLSYRVYYSESIDASKDDETAWKESPDNWNNIKSYKVVIEDEVQAKTSIEFYYYVTLPEKWKYGTATYATHAVYYKTRVNGSEEAIEPEKVGLKIGGSSYKLELKDYKFNTYNDRITHATEDKQDAKATVQLKGDIYGDEWSEEAKREVGATPARYDNLYVGATYVVRQTEIDDPYILDTNEIRFRVVENEYGNLKVQILNEQGEPELDPEKYTNGFFKNATMVSGTLRLDVQNKYKYKIVVENKVKGGEEYINGSEFTLKGVEQDKEGSTKTAKNGTETWGNYVLDQWTITQNAVGEEKYEKDNEEHTLNVTADEDGSLVVNDLGKIEQKDVWVENVDDFTKQPIVHVVIRNDYKPAEIHSTKTASVPRKDYVLAGEEITYTITVNNTGYKAQDVVIKDTIPAETDFVANSIKVLNGDGSDAEENVTYTQYTKEQLAEGITVNVEPQETKKVEFKVTVKELPEGTYEREIKNTAQIDTDGDGQPNETPESDPVQEKKPDLVVTKKANKTGYVTRGDEITYTIELDNKNGTAPVHVTVKDPIPEHTTFVAGSIKVLDEDGNSDNKIYADNDLTTNGIVVVLKAGEKKSIEFKLKVQDSDIGDEIRNVAKYWEQDPTEPEPQPPEDLTPEKEKETEPVVNPYQEPQMSSTKESKLILADGENREYALEGDTIEYTITVTNSGDMEGNATIKDNIPAGTEFISESIKIVNKAGDEQKKGDGSDYTSDELKQGIDVKVPAGDSKILTFKVRVLALAENETTKQIENTAAVAYKDEYKPDDDPTSEPVTENKSDLTVVKKNNPTQAEPVKVGDTINYTIELDNTKGTAPAKTVVKDTIPDGTVFVNGTIVVKINDSEQAEKSYDENSLNVGIPVEVPAKGKATVEFQVKVSQSKTDLENGAEITNVATVTENIPNKGPEEHTSEVKNPYHEPVINGTKTACVKLDNDETRNYAIEGDEITYTITLENTGDLEGTATVQDEAPAGTTFVDGSIVVKVDGEQKSDSYDENDLRDGIDITVPANKTATLEFKVRVNEISEKTGEIKETIENIATVTPKPDPDVPDPDPEHPEPKPDPEHPEIKTPVIITEKKAKVSREAEGEVNEDSATMGDTITYTITVRNISEVNAENVVIKDTVPTGTTLKSANGGQIDEAQKNITWTIGSLASGESQGVSFEVTVTEIPEENKIHNVATVGEKETNPTDTNYVKPEVVVDKKSEVTTNGVIENKEYVTAGDIITYTLTITNNGGAEGTVTIKDPISEYVTLVEGSIKVKNNKGEVEAGPEEGYKREDLETKGITVKVKPEETKTLEFQVEVQNLEGTEIIKNKGKYTVTGPNYNTDNPDPTPDPDPKEEKETKEVEDPYKEPKITVEKTSDIKSGQNYVVVGDIITYTVTVRNSGNLGADVKVSDTVPTGTIFVPNSIAVEVNGQPKEPVDEAYTYQKLQEGIDINVPEGGTATVKFKVKVTESTGDLKDKQKIKNTARIEETVPNEKESRVYEPIVENEYKEANITSEKTAKIQLQDEDTRNSAINGDRIEYTITLTNDGSIDGEALVKDIAPEGTRIEEGTIKVFDGEGNEIKKAEEEPYTSEELEVGIKVPVEANNTARVTFNVIVELGEKKAEGVKVIENKAEVIPQKPTPPSPEPGEPEPKEPEPEKQEPKVKTPLIHFNKTAQVEQKGGIYIDENSAMIGDVITYTITVTNDGDEKATNITVKDIVPEGTAYNAVDDGGAYDEETNSVTWTIEELAPAGTEGSTKSVRFTVTVTGSPAENKIENVATVGDKPTEKTETKYVQPDINATKDAVIELEPEEERTYAVAGDTIKYTIKLTNNGGVEGKAKVKDTVPDGTTLVGDSIRVLGTNGEEEPREGDKANEPYTADDLSQGIVLTLGPGETKKVEFKVTVSELQDGEKEKKIKNIAQIDTDGDEDPDKQPESPEISEYKSKLVVTKKNNPEESVAVKIGDEITYTIELDNTNGTAPADTIVKDKIPEGTIFEEGSIIVKINEQVQSAPEESPYNEDSLNKGIPVKVPAGEKATVEFKVRVSQATVDLKNGQEIKNKATVTENIPNKDPKDYTPEVKNTYHEPEIKGTKEGIVKLLDGTTRKYAQEGDEITYTIILKNDGDEKGTATVKDTAPAGTKFVPGSIVITVNNEPKQEEHDDQDLMRGIDIEVPARGTATLEFRVQVNEISEKTESTEETIKNIAILTQKPDPNEPSPDPKPDPDPDDPKVDTPVIITEKKAEVSRKSKDAVNENSATMGDTITYTITVKNISEVDAENIVIKDTVPEGTTFKSAQGTEQVDDEQKNIEWTIQSLRAGESQEVSFVVEVTSVPESGKIENVATVGGKETNHTDTDYVKPEIDVEKSSKINLKDGEPTREYVTAGDTITYTLTITNNGGAEGTVTIKDPISDDVTLIGGSIKVKNSKNEEETAPEKGYTEEDLKNNGITVKVKPEETKTLEFQVKVKDLEGVDNIRNQGKYTVTGPNYDPDNPEPTPKPDPDPNEEKQTQEVVDPYKEAKIETSKTSVIKSGKDYAVVGDIITYTITVTNSGNLGADVKVKDTVPAGTIFVPNSIVVKVNEEPQRPVDEEYTEEKLKAGIDIKVPESGTATVEFKVKVTESKGNLINGQDIENTATVEETVPNSEEPRISKPKAKNEYKEANITSEKTSAIQLQEGDTRNSAINGDEIAYTITLKNDGGIDGEALVKDTAPEGTRIEEETIKVFDGEGNEIKKDGEEPYTEDDLRTGIKVQVKANSTAKVTFNVIVELGEKKAEEIKVIKNQAEVIPQKPTPTDPDEPETKEPDPQPQNPEVKDPLIHFNKTAEVSQKGNKYDSTDSAMIGDEITYTITITNDGDETATDIVVKDSVPTGTTLVRAEDGGEPDEERQNITWRIGEIDSNASKTVSFVVEVTEEPSEQKIKNVATVGNKSTNETENKYVKPDISGIKHAEIELADGEDSRAYAVAGDTIKYTITVTNKGGVEGTTVVKDDIPDGTTLKDGSIKVIGNDEVEEQRQGEKAGEPYTADELSQGIELTLGPKETKKIVFEVTVLPLEKEQEERQIKNTAQIGDNDNPSSETIPQYDSHLEVTKTNDPGQDVPVKVGDIITYYINLDNRTGKAPVNVKVRDHAPDGTIFVKNSIKVKINDDVQDATEETSFDENKLNEGIDVVVPANGTVVVEFQVRVSEHSHDLENGTSITNMATVIEEKPNEEPKTHNPEVSNKYQEPDIKGTKTGVVKLEDGTDRMYAQEGDDITYTITLKNEGDLEGKVTVTDTIPDGTTFVPESIVVAGEPRKELSTDDLERGIEVTVGAKDTDTATVTVEFKVHVEEITEETREAIKNVATVTPKPDPKEPDPENPEPDPKPENPEVKTPVIKTEKKAKVSRDGEGVVKENCATMGDTITYTITVRNISDEIANNIVIKDTIPEGTTFKSAEGEKYTHEGNEITWTIETLAGGDSQEVSFVVEVTSVPENKKIDNVATVGGKDTNHTETNYVRPEVEVHKTSEITTSGSKEERNYVTVGDIITYKLTITNKGGAEGTVTIKDPISDNVDLIVDSIKVKDKLGEEIAGPEEGYTKEDLTSKGIVVNVEPNETKTLEFQVKVKDLEGVESIKNQGTYTVTGPNYDPDDPTPDPNPNDEKQTEEVENPYKEPNISVEKTSAIKSGNEYVVVGDIITYTITVRNSGNLETNVKVKDTVPTGTIFVPKSIVVKVNDEPKEPADKVYTEQELQEGIDINVPEGGTATVAFKVKVTESEGNLTNGQNIENTVTVEEKIPNTEETRTHTSTVQDEYKEADITSEKTATIQLEEGDTRNSVTEGDTINYSITLKNAGGIDGEALVKDTVPKGTKLIDGTIKVFDGDNQEITKSEGESYTEDELRDGIKVLVKANSTAKVTFSVRVELEEQTAEEVEVIKNTAEVIPQKPDPVNPDPEPEEPDPEEPDPDPQKPEVKTPLIHFNKTAVVTQKGGTYSNKESAMLGDEIKYTITITNDGDEVATNIVIKDEVPEGTELVSQEEGQVDEGKQNITWTIAEIGAKESKSVSFVVRVTEAPVDGKIRNSALVGDKPTNETETTYVKPDIVGKKKAEIELAEEVARREYVVAGDTIKYTITVTNKGGVEGTATVTDKVPDGTTLVSGSVKVIDSDETEQTKEDDALSNGIELTLGPNETNKIEFKVTVLPLGEGETEKQIKNTAHIEDDDDSPEDDPDDNPSSEPIPEYASDLKVTKTNEPTQDVPVKVGDIITYYINLDNTDGKAEAKVKVKDQAPAGTMFVEDSIHVTINDVDQKVQKNEEDLNSGIDIVVPEGQKAVLSFQVKVSQGKTDLANGAEIKNVATVEEEKPGEDPKTHKPQVTNEYHEANITGAKTGVVKLEGDETRDYAISGDEITYIITLTNTGDEEGTVIVTDEAPEGTAFVPESIVIAGVPHTDLSEDSLRSGIEVTVGAKGSGNETVTLEFKVKVNEITEEMAETIKNIATITDKPDPEDPDPKPDPDPQKPEVKTPVIKTEKKAEVSREGEGVVKENSATMGDTITYKIKVSNISEVDAENIIIKDTIPEGTTLKSINGENHVHENNEITWTIETLAGGESQEVSFVVEVTSVPENKKIDNVATVGGKETNHTETSYVKPEVEVVKSTKVNVKEGEDDRSYVTAGDTITYTLTITNKGGAEGTVTIKDPISEHVTLVDGSIKVKKGEEDETPEQGYSKDDLTTNGIVVKVKPNEEKTLEFQVTVKDLDNVDSIKNQGKYTVTGPNYDPDEPEQNPDPDPKTEEKTNEVENPYKEPNISSTKSAKVSSEHDYAIPGDTITYTIEITNSGNLAKKVKVKDSAPEGTTFVNESVKIGEKGKEVAETQITEEQLEAGIEVEVKENSTVNVIFEVTVDDLKDDNKVGKISNTANVDDEDTPTVDTTVDKSDLKIKKINDPTEIVTKGQTITYTILLDNSRGTAPTTVKVKDSIPKGTDFVFGSIQVQEHKGDNLWQGDGKVYDQTELEGEGIEVTIPESSKKRVQFKVKVQDLDNGTKIPNTATIIDTIPDGQHPEEDPQERTTNKVENTYVEADITVNKIATPEFGRNYVTEGEKIKYTITITNNGDLEETITVKDAIPDKTEFVEGSIEVLGAHDVKVNKTYSKDDLITGIPVEVQPQSTAKVIFEVKVLTISEEESGVMIRNIATYKEPKKDPEDPDPEEKPTPEVKTPVMKYSKKAEITRNTEEKIDEGAVTAGDVIKYTITIKNISEEDATNIEVRDKVPEGTVLKDIYDDGHPNGEGEIVWKIAHLGAGDTATVSFDVTVSYQSKDAKIKNVATVDGQPTNPEETPYKEPEPKLTDSVEKSGDEKLTDETAKVRYTLKYNATIKDFKGRAKITIVDTLPYPIDEMASSLDNGNYDHDHTITWEETIEVDTYTEQNNLIERVKNLELKYNYPEGQELSGNIDNNVKVTIELIQQEDDPEDLEHPQKDVVVKEDTVEDDHTVHVEIPAEVVVHHYIYDEDRGGETTERLADDETLKGIVGQEYTTDPLKGEELDPNYECVNPDPEEDNHKGTMTKEPKEAVYYYKLKDPTIENSVDKTAEASIQEEREFETGQFEEDGRTPIKETRTVQVLTQEDGVVKYSIKQHVKVGNYKGKVTITITDKLPAKIDEDASELQDGKYDEETQTITWTEERNIDTFTKGAYEETIIKDIEIVYKDQNVLEPLVNTVNAKVTLYNPESYTPDPSGERKTDEKEDTEVVEQRYTVDQEVEKVWDDNEDRKNRRPTSVTVELTADGLPTGNKAVLSADNDWTATFNGLAKYGVSGNKIAYSVIETETNPGELLFYEAPTIMGENPIVVTNRYRTMQANVDAHVDKVGPQNESITSSSQKIKYQINYTANLTDYRGDARLKIIDYLPYHIDLAKSNIHSGVYDSNTKTITWELPMNNISTYETGSYLIQFNTEIELVFTDMEPTISILSNKVDAILDLYETDSSSTVTDTETTPVDIKGKLIVHYKDKATGEELTYEENGEQKKYQYEDEQKVGTPYVTDRKTIPDYLYDSVEGKEVGTYVEGTTEVTYWYKSDKSGGVDVKWVDEDGNDIVPPEHIPGEGEIGRIGDPYHTEPKDFDDYVLDYVEGEPDGTLPEGTGEVVYHYKRRIGRVIVQYLEKGTDKELLPEKVEEYPVGDSYTTERERVPDYRRADPEPENKNGIVTKEDTYVKYYYERIPSGKVVTKHVDVETGEDILHPDEETGEYVPYGDIQTGYVGDSYTTEPEEIPYYKLVEELLPPNREGIFEEEDKEVIYYYVKQTFNFKVDKVITKAMINGDEQKVLDGKLIKVEIVGSEMEDTEVVITYKIRVTNTGEIPGTATVVEKLPKHFTIGKEAYNEWTENEDGNLEAEVTLEPGETKEFTIKLTWKNGSENFGREINTAEIKGFENDAHYEDKDKEDNISEAEVVMGVKTGAPIYIFFMACSVVILTAIAVTVVYVRKNK